MASNKLTNYLRAYRKRAGLTQRDLAFLLGVKARGAVSELEKRRRVPVLRTALTLSAIFDVPAEELFAGMRESIVSDIDARLEKLASELAPKVGTNKRHEYHTARKLQWLEARRGTAVPSSHEPNRPASHGA